MVGREHKQFVDTSIWYNFIYKQKGTISFNDALNSFYLRLYGIGDMLKDHSDIERENSLTPFGYSFRLTTI